MSYCPAGSVLSHGEKVLLKPWLVVFLVILSQQKYLMRLMFYCIDQPCTQSFPIGLVKTESESLDQAILTYGYQRWW